MRFLELKIPAIAIAAVIAALSWALARTGPALPLSSSIRLAITALLAIVGMAIAAAGIVEFLRAQTTINPHRPQHTSVLVTTGIYRYTRNPMYLGLLLLLAAWAVLLGSLWALAPLILYILYMDRFQIQPEERALSVAFGTDYAVYRSRVRRWV